MLRREAVTAVQQQLRIGLLAGHVHRRAALPALNRSGGKRLLCKRLAVVEVVGLEQRAVDPDPKSLVRHGMAVGDPAPQLVVEACRGRVALTPALEQMLRRVAMDDPLAREGSVAASHWIGGHRRPRRKAAHVAQVALADELITLYAVLRRRAAAAVLEVAGHRLAHAAAEIADATLTDDVSSERSRRARDRVADCDVAQVTDVQRLRRVGIAEVDDPAAPWRDHPRCERVGLPPLERGAEPLELSVGEAHAE